MCWDKEDTKSIGALLCRLRRWRRGEFKRSIPWRKAGGHEQMTEKVWLWGETLWLEALEGFEEVKAEGRKCGGRRSRKEIAQEISKKEGDKIVNLNPDFNGDLEIQAQV